MNGKSKIDAERCKACLLCMEVCKQNRIKAGTALNKAGYVPVVGDETIPCKGCALCAIRCPEVAIEVYIER